MPLADAWRQQILSAGAKKRATYQNLGSLDSSFLASFE